MNPPLALRFSVAVENRGVYSLEVRGLPRGLDDLLGNPPRRQANQCIGWLDRVCTETTPVGELVYDDSPGHDHWHFEDFALYELRHVLADETPDLSDGGLEFPARKASFCLLDDRQARGMGSGNPLMDQYGLYWRCDEKRQGISPGWADEYGWELDGQQIPLAGVADGTYALVITANPLGRLLETSRDDNVTWTVIDIVAGGTRVIEH